MGFPQLVENGVENRKFSVERRWKARIFEEIPRFHRKRRAEKAGEKKGALRNRFPIRLLQLSSIGAAFSGHTDAVRFCPCFCDFAAPSVGTRRAVSADLRQAHSVENVPPERFQGRSTASGTQGGAVLFAPPSKSCRFSHPPSPCAQKYGHGDFAVCGRRLRGHVPSKNTSPTVLSWISLFGHTDAVRFCSCTMGFVPALVISQHPL